MWLRAADGSVNYDAPFMTGAAGITDMTFGFDADGNAALYYVTIGGELRVVRSAPELLRLLATKRPATR